MVRNLNTRVSKLLEKTEHYLIVGRFLHKSSNSQLSIVAQILYVFTNILSVWSINNKQKCIEISYYYGRCVHFSLLSVFVLYFWGFIKWMQVCNCPILPANQTYHYIVTHFLFNIAFFLKNYCIWCSLLFARYIFLSSFFLRSFCF